MLKRTKFTTPYGFNEPDQFELLIKEDTAFVNVLRVGLKTKINVLLLDCFIGNFSSTDPNINYNFFVNQMKQIRISKIPQGKLSFYAENKTNGLKPFGTFNLLLNGKPLNLKEYEIDDYEMGHIYPGTYVDVRLIEPKESTMLGASEVRWVDLDYDQERPFDTCYDYQLFWKSYVPDSLKVVCEALIEQYKGWKGKSLFEGDCGFYANLVEEYILDDKREAYVRREFYSVNKSTKIDARQEDIDKAIDLITSKLKKYAELKPK